MSPTRIVSTFHQPSAVVSSCKCRLSSTAEHLVVAKLNAIEVHTIESTGLKHACALQIWGKVLSVKEVPITVRSTIEAPSLLLRFFVGFGSVKCCGLA